MRAGVGHGMGGARLSHLSEIRHAPRCSLRLAVHLIRLHSAILLVPSRLLIALRCFTFGESGARSAAANRLRSECNTPRANARAVRCVGRSQWWASLCGQCMRVYMIRATGVLARAHIPWSEPVRARIRWAQVVPTRLTLFGLKAVCQCRCCGGVVLINKRAFAAHTLDGARRAGMRVYPRQIVMT
jgi:hypothetical protein